MEQIITLNKTLRAILNTREDLYNIVDAHAASSDEYMHLLDLQSLAWFRSVDPRYPTSVYCRSIGLYLNGIKRIGKACAAYLAARATGKSDWAQSWQLEELRDGILGGIRMVRDGAYQDMYITRSLRKQLITLALFIETSRPANQACQLMVAVLGALTMVEIFLRSPMHVYEMQKEVNVVTLTISDGYRSWMESLLFNELGDMEDF